LVKSVIKVILIKLFCLGLLSFRMTQRLYDYFELRRV